jgi:hypothetical protein
METNNGYIESIIDALGLKEFREIEQLILKMMDRDTTKDCATGTCD